MIIEPYKYKKPAYFSRFRLVEIKSVKILFISGMPGIDSKGRVVSNDFKRQAYQSFENIESILKKFNMGWKDVVKTTVFISDIRYYDALNEVRKNFFASRKIKEFPASSCVEARLINPLMLIEQEAIAIG